MLIGYYAAFQKILSGPLTTILLTLLGVVGSALTLVAADTSLPPKLIRGLLVAGAIIAIVFNLASSLGAHITPNPSPTAQAKDAAKQKAKDAEAATSKVIINMQHATVTTDGATAADLEAGVVRVVRAALDARKARASSPAVAAAV